MAPPPLPASPRSTLTSVATSKAATVVHSLSHFLVALPVLFGALLDKAGGLSVGMQELLTVLTFVFGAAHVASFLHQSAIVKAQAMLSAADGDTAGKTSTAGALIHAISDTALQLLNATSAQADANATTPPAGSELSSSTIAELADELEKRARAARAASSTVTPPATPDAIRGAASWASGKGGGQ